MVVEGGRVTTVDAGKLAAMAEAAVARLRVANEATRTLAQRLEPVVGSFCRALAGREYHVQRYGAQPAR
jgi:hypothetical protein